MKVRNLLGLRNKVNLLTYITKKMKQGFQAYLDRDVQDALSPVGNILT